MWVGVVIYMYSSGGLFSSFTQKGMRVLAVGHRTIDTAEKIEVRSCNLWGRGM